MLKGKVFFIFIYRRSRSRLTVGEASHYNAGLVVHEVLGLGVLATAWAGCYLLRPSGTNSMPYTLTSLQHLPFNQGWG